MTSRRNTTPRSTPDGKAPDGKAPGAAAADHHQEDLLDEALAETFPASDPISTLSTGDGGRG